VRYEPRQALAYDRQHRVREYRLWLEAEVELVDVKTGKTLRPARRITAKSEYLVGKDVVETQDAEKEAQKRAAWELARDLLTYWLEMRP